MKNKELTIITAYFDIGRGNYTSDFKRGNNKYINYFKFWSGIKNNLIIYTQKEFENEILEIRDKKGLKEKTKIIVIDDIYALLPEIYQRMDQIEHDNYYQKFRYIKSSPDNLAKYDYIMLLKTWCLKNAFDNKYIKTDMVSWLDFGFNHGGVCYTNSADFDFLWTYPFEDKIYLSTPKIDENKPLFHIIQSGEVYAQGALYFLPTKLINTFYELILEATYTLLDIGFIDDDQTLLLMAYRKNKEIFIYEESDWFLSLKKYGGNHLAIKDKSQIPLKSIKDKALIRYRIIKRNDKAIKDLKSIFKKDYLD